MERHKFGLVLFLFIFIFNEDMKGNSVKKDLGKVYVDKVQPEHKSFKGCEKNANGQSSAGMKWGDKNIIPNLRKKELLSFCNLVNIQFNDLSLLNQAFNHRSITNERKEVENNERLEFLGDSVLGMSTAAYLFKSMDNPEGDLAKIKSAVVSEKALAPIAIKFGIDKLLVLGHGEELSGGRQKPAILADCMEAIIGAYYLDAGFKAAEKYVLSFIVPEIEKVCTYGMKDFKTLLQEKYQQVCKQCPKYELVGKSGPDHAQVFSISVHLGDKVFGPAKATTKKEAEQIAAKMALDQFQW